MDPFLIELTTQLSILLKTLWLRFDTQSFKLFWTAKMRLVWSTFVFGASVLVGTSQAQAQCPDYTSYSQTPHDPRSSGVLALPYMRPAPACRTFNSSAVEKVITDMKSLLKDPDLARLFENTFPNTLDTTVKYYNKACLNIIFAKTLITCQIGGKSCVYYYWGQSLSLLINGHFVIFDQDITAQWLRDTANQFAHYHSLLGVDPELAALVKAVINNEARYVAEYPYCGAFQPPPESGLAPTVNDWAIGVTVNPPVDNQTVFECKYELDSLCGFLKLSRSYYQTTKDASFMNNNWRAAIDQIFRVINEQSQASFDENFNFISYYNWTGGAGLGSRYIMDDANVPSLLSLPYLGFLDKHHPAYVATRKLLLSRKNPYYAAGKTFNGVGGPHVDPWHPWPMSHISAIFGTDNDREILQSLYIIANNHLPNKRHIGKQDPYCLVTVNGEKRRTKAIKRGGQHPEWDEELRFTLFEDVDDVLARTAHGDGTPPPPPPKDGKRTKNIKGGKTMKLACYADDPREPDLIGETDVDLTEVLTKGETDEWFTLTNKDKFAGKVYLELTFWSNEPPPEKKVTPKLPKGNKQYAGPGSFVASGDFPASSPSRQGGSRNHGRQNSDVIPSSLRVSGSAANLDLYVAPYERNRNQQMDNLTQEFGDFGFSQHRRRESFPPVPGQYSQAPQFTGGQSTLTFYPPNTYDQGYQYDRPVTPNGQPSHFAQAPASGLYDPYSPYQPAYEIPSTVSTYHPPARGPRHSIPTASSGFMPLPQPSGFVPIPSHISEPSGFMPPVSHTPAPMNYPSQFQSVPQGGYPPPLSHTPAPQTNESYLPQSTSFPQQSFPAAQPYNYPSYGISPSASAPPQQFVPTPAPQSNFVPPATSAPPQLYTGQTASHEGSPVQAPPSQSLPTGQSSRPLPQQPQVVYAQPPVPQQTLTPSQSLPLPATSNQQPSGFVSTQPGTIYPANNAYSSVPPPPPPPPLQYNNSNSVQNVAQLPVPPPPPIQPRRRASLPQPPTTYQQPVYQQPPPPPPVGYFNQIQVPPPPPPPIDNSFNTQNGTYPPGPPPKPPAPVDEHGQWIQPPNTYSTGVHIQQAY
ncbi:hypothetical protein NLJ89_g2306 [Agrocybe chaxingu]|uniref:C2 domain-containing protein n=1 Tax=Agrocybe chaxingu TaxID=84603 RepID=A0A9W8K719_9AGAR|nr:hypothetical protein NLJ89_g2306 [Agrocybe chaxingu]